MATTLADLPVDVLRAIGACVGSDDSDLVLIARDAASCEVCGGAGFHEIAEGAWRACARAAETFRTVDAYRSYWHVAARPLRKADVAPLARAIGLTKASTAMWRIRDALAVDQPVGRFCSITRPAALFVLEASQCSLLATRHPAFRDRDLTQCATTPAPRQGMGAVVRLCDALRAPTIDPAHRFREERAKLDALDADFQRAGFTRAWGETDVAARVRLDAARRWVDRVKAPAVIAATVITRAHRGATIDYPSVEQTVRAYNFAQVAPSPSFAWTFFVWETRPDRLAAHTRGDIFSTMQREILGGTVFMLDDTVMPTLADDEIDSVRCRLLRLWDAVQVGDTLPQTLEQALALYDLDDI